MLFPFCEIVGYAKNVRCGNRQVAYYNGKMPDLKPIGIWRYVHFILKLELYLSGLNQSMKKLLSFKF